MTITRRDLLATALATGAVGALPVGAHAAASRPVPRTLVAVAPAGARSGSADFSIGYLGVTWTGNPDGGGEVRFRTGAGWAEPLALPHPDAIGASRHGVLVPAGGAVGYEVRPGAGATELQTVAINTTDGPPTSLAAAATNRAGVRYLSRAAWGADESLRFDENGDELFPPAYFPVQTFTVHHTVTANDDPDPAATVRAIYFFHTVTQEFGDIGYHLLIDQNGTVYEGRWSGPDPVPVFEGGQPPPAAPRMSNGAHVGGFNAGNVGVALLGDLTNTQPTAAARRSLVSVLAVLTRYTNVDPLARITYVNPISGATADVDTIPGHRDWAATECPGNTFYPTLPDLRREVAALRGSGEGQHS